MITTYDPTKDPQVAQELLNRGVLSPDTVNAMWPTPAIVDAVVQQESSGNPDAVGPETPYGHAYGAMQLLPSTATDVAQKHGLPAPSEQDLLNPETSKQLGSQYLADLYKKYQDPKLALAAYHSGPGNVDAAIKKAGTSEPDAVIAQLGPVGQRYPDQTLARVNQEQPPQQSEAAAMPTPPEQQDAASRFETGIKSQQAAALEQLDAQKQISTKMGEVQAAEAERTRQAAAQELEQRQREDDAIQRVRTSYQSAVTDLSTSKIDPGRLWNNMGTPQKILAGISLVLGGLSAGLTRTGQNPALNVIQHAIDNDIEAQRANLAAKESGAHLQGSLYSDLLQQTGSERAARESLRALAYQSAKMQVESLSQQLSSVEKQGQAQQLVGQLEQKAAEYQQKAEELAAKDPNAIAQQVNQVGAGTRDIKTLPREEQQRMVPGLGLARSLQDAQEIAKAQEAQKNFGAKIDSLINLRTKYGSETLPGKVKTQMQTTAVAAKLQLKSIYQLGALSKGDYAILDDLLGDPTAYSSTYGLGTDTVLTQLQTLKKQAEDSYKATLNSRLLQKFPAAEKLTTDINVTPGVR